MKRASFLRLSVPNVNATLVSLGTYGGHFKMVFLEMVANSVTKIIALNSIELSHSAQLSKSAFISDVFEIAANCD